MEFPEEGARTQTRRIRESGGNDFTKLEFSLDTKNWNEGVYNAVYIDKTSNNKSSKNHPSVKQDNTNPPSIPKIVINDVSYKNLQLLMLLYTIILNLNNKQEANNSINKILYTLNLVECNSKCDKYDKFIEQYMDIMKNNSSSEPDKIFQLIIKYIHQPIIQNNDSLITMLSKPNYDDIINNNKELNEDVKNAYKQLFEIANKISNNNLNQAISDLKTKSFNTLQTKLKNLLSNNKKEEAIPTLEALLNNKELALCHSFITQLIAIFKDNNNNTQEDILTAYNKLISNIDNTEIKPLLLKLLAIKIISRLITMIMTIKQVLIIIIMRMSMSG